MTTTIIVTKSPDGKLEGVGEKCRTALLKFQLWVDRLEPGEIFTMDVWMPRNPKFHKLHFVMLGALFDRQERFEDAEHLRAWLQVGAGYCDFIPGPARSRELTDAAVALLSRIAGRYPDLKAECIALAGRLAAEPNIVAVPKSIAYSKMDEIAFAEHHAAVKAFMRSPHALNHLWPHLGVYEAGEIVEGILADVERPNK